MVITVKTVTFASVSKKSRIAVRLLPERFLPFLAISSNTAYRMAFNISLSDTKYFCRHLQAQINFNEENYANILG